MIAELFALFGAGVASILSPCSVVLVPAYIAMLTGETDTRRSPARLVGATALFTAGFTTVFVAFGVGAALVSANVSGVRHSLTIVGGALLVVFGLLKLGAPLPVLRGDYRLLAAVPAANDIVRPYVFGVTFGAVWSPCVGPLLGTALTIAAQSAHPARGALLLSAYGLGTGAGFVAATLVMIAAPGLGGALRRLARHLEKVAGAVILIAGLALLTGIYTRATDWLQTITPPVLRGL